MVVGLVVLLVVVGLLVVDVVDLDLKWNLEAHQVLHSDQKILSLALLKRRCFVDVVNVDLPH